MGDLTDQIPGAVMLTQRLEVRLPRAPGPGPVRTALPRRSPHGLLARIARLGPAAINPIGLLVDRATANDPLYFPRLAADEREAHPVVEPPAELWSAQTTDDQLVGSGAPALPQLEPNPTLAAAIAARVALEAARQPVTPNQLAARQAALHREHEIAPDGEPADGKDRAA